ncbi:hypothetical protein PAMP_023274 [Pampus punctatissimus]
MTCGVELTCVVSTDSGIQTNAQVKVTLSICEMATRCSELAVSYSLRPVFTPDLFTFCQIVSIKSAVQLLAAPVDNYQGLPIGPKAYHPETPIVRKCVIGPKAHRPKARYSKNTLVGVVQPPLLASFPIIPFVHATKHPPSAACGPSERGAPSRHHYRRHYSEAWRPHGSSALPLNPKHGAVGVVVVLLCLLSCIQIDALHKQHAGCLGSWNTPHLLWVLNAAAPSSPHRSSCVGSHPAPVAAAVADGGRPRGGMGGDLTATWTATPAESECPQLLPVMSQKYPYRCPPLDDLGTYSSSDHRHASPHYDLFSPHQELPSRLSSFSSYPSSSSSSRGSAAALPLPQGSTDGALNILSSCGLEPSDLSLLAKLPEDILTVESLPHLLQQLKGKRGTVKPPAPNAPSSSSSSSSPSYSASAVQRPAGEWDRLHCQPVCYPLDPVPPGPLPSEQVQDHWGNQSSSSFYTTSSRTDPPPPCSSSSSSRYMVDFSHRAGFSDYCKTVRDAGPASFTDQRSFSSPAGRGGRSRPPCLSQPGDYSSAPPPEQYHYRPQARRCKSEVSPSRSSSSRTATTSTATSTSTLPSKKEALDFHGSLPTMYPYSCSLCDVTVLSEKTSEKGKVVCVKFPPQSVDETYLRKLSEPFGKIGKILMFPSLAFVELASIDQARDLVKFHNNYPPTVNGEQMEFSISNTFNFLQVFVELKNAPDAEKMVDYYSSNTLRINSDLIKVSFSGEYKSLMQVPSAKRYEEETCSTKRTRSLSTSPQDKTSEPKRRRSGRMAPEDETTRTSTERKAGSKDKSRERSSAEESDIEGMEVIGEDGDTLEDEDLETPDEADMDEEEEEEDSSEQDEEKEVKDGEACEEENKSSRAAEEMADNQQEDDECLSTRVVYFRNLPQRFYTDADFIRLVKGFGKAVRYFLIRRRQEGFIEMSSSSEALRAATELSCKSVSFNGSKLIVHISHKYSRLTAGWTVQSDEDERSKQRSQSSRRRSNGRSKSKTSERDESNQNFEDRKESSKKTPEAESTSKKTPEAESTSKKTPEAESTSKRTPEAESTSKKTPETEMACEKTEEKNLRKTTEDKSTSKKTPEAESTSKKTPETEMACEKTEEKNLRKTTEDEPAFRETEEKDSGKENLLETSEEKLKKCEVSDENSVSEKILKKELTREKTEQELEMCETLSEDQQVCSEATSESGQKNPDGPQTEQDTAAGPVEDAAAPHQPSKPVGTEFVRPVVGYFCNLCQVIYVDEDEAKLQHCSSRSHYIKYQVSSQYSQLLQTQLLVHIPDLTSDLLILTAEDKQTSVFTSCAES